MHCIVPFAAPAPSAQAGRAAMAAMQWPRLAALLPRLTLVDRDEGEVTSFSPPHERVLARALGWPLADAAGGLPTLGTVPPPGAAQASPAAATLAAITSNDGCWPIAAHLARADGIDPGQRAWGLVSPVHWHLGTDQVSLTDPELLQLDEQGSRALFEAVKPLLVEEGLDFVFGHALRWYVAHESLAGLRTASLDRVVGRNVDPWLGSGADAPALRRWRRLQAEVQMLLHSHPLNSEREARGLLPVNSFWLSGCGRAAVASAAGVLQPQFENTLRAAALAEDWDAWAAGWRRIEDGALLGLDLAWRRGNDAWLTLCGECSAVTFAPMRGGFASRLKSLLTRPSVPKLLASL